jgi:hypothetical protein
MASRSCILLYGRVPLLLDTRLMVLETGDLRVLTATDIDEVERIITTCDIDLVIFCHTLSTQERKVALAAIHALRPRLQTLALTSISAMPRVLSEIDVLASVDGPRDLIAVAKLLLNRPDTLAAQPVRV